MGLNKKLFIQADTGVVGTENFNTVLYTGDGTSSRGITGVGFQPDLMWIKKRSSATNAGHMWFDSVRGLDKVIGSDRTNAEYDGGGAGAGYMNSVDSDGFTLTGNALVNQSGETYVAWNWKAASSDSTNTDGSITSTVRANQAAGFSIVSYTGNSSYGQTVGHGLNSAPELIIIKNRDNARNWRTYAEPLGATKYVNLDETAAAATYGSFNNTAPTSTVFSTTNSDADRATNFNGDNYIAYCFHSVDGYSKIGTYTGTGASQSISVGFQPRFVIIKRTNSTGNWEIYDSQRGEHIVIQSDNSNAEYDYSTTGVTDFNTNSFTVAGTAGNHNASGSTYIYMAFK